MKESASKSKGIGGHHRPFRGETDEWLTPPEIIAALGPFDLDPCVPFHQPYPTAERRFTQFEDGLWQPWDGFVWLNPPYGPETTKWVDKLSIYRHGLTLIFARTETEMFHRFIWERSVAVFFLEGRLHFHHTNGVRAKANSGAPSVIAAYDAEGVERLRRGNLPGRLVELGRIAA